ncbi:MULTISPECIES: GPP34 family phosphoprotein [Streptomyces]|uniref:GPP34 family phosphoprotein n=1 Tax=Streptomyces liliiviolaceus TaxID=2823109 RepID=A0A940XJY4_9ACTN|nr:GPP34 family phosphoprotein [Streptomyces liliiviolaceus]MBQ0847414.1 GPP34 family phosphoprotein [Streptomyces liliiviolaceus]
MIQGLPQHLYLLCYTVDKGKFQLDNLQGRGQLLRAGALTELARDGLLDATGGKVIRKSGRTPDDSFLASVWSDLPDNRPKSWLQFVHNKAHTAEKPVRDQLAAAGEVTVTRNKVLGLVPSDRVTVTQPENVRALQERVRGTVLDRTDPASIPLEDLALAVLTVELEVTCVWSRADLRTHKQALKALAARYDETIPGLRKALRDSYLASRAVGGGWSA